MFPEGIATRQLKVGPAFDLVTGAPLGIRVMVSPTRPLIWGDSQDPVVPALKDYRFKPNEPGLIELPVTDQGGWRTTAGNPISLEPGDHAFGYKISTFYLRGNSVVKTLPQRTITLPAGDLSVVDIDEVVTYADENSGLVISTPDSWTQTLEEAKELAENIPATVDATIDSWLVEHDLPATRTNLNTLGWAQFIILAHDADASSVPDGTFIVRLPEGFTP